MQRFVYTGLLLTAFVVLGVSTVVRGDGDEDNRYQLRLNGFQENPSISTTGNGRLSVEIRDDAEMIEFRLRYSDLEGVLNGGVVTQAHIHIGALHTNGGVVAFLCGGGGKPPCPSPDGDIQGTIVPSDIVGPAAQGLNPGEATTWAEFVRAIRAGYTYGNVHTTRWPGGEVRGQIGNRQNHHE
jgi:hypothetical protein